MRIDLGLKRMKPEFRKCCSKLQLIYFSAAAFTNKMGGQIKAKPQTENKQVVEKIEKDVSRMPHEEVERNAPILQIHLEWLVESRANRVQG